MEIMKINKLLTLYVTVLSTLIITSCHDELDTVPLSTLAPENFFNDVDEAEIAVNGVYDKMAERLAIKKGIMVVMDDCILRQHKIFKGK